MSCCCCCCPGGRFPSSGRLALWGRWSWGSHGGFGDSWGGCCNGCGYRSWCGWCESLNFARRWRWCLCQCCSWHCDRYWHCRYRRSRRGSQRAWRWRRCYRWRRKRHRHVIRVVWIIQMSRWSCISIPRRHSHSHLWILVVRVDWIGRGMRIRVVRVMRMVVIGIGRVERHGRCLGVSCWGSDCRHLWLRGRQRWFRS